MHTPVKPIPQSLNLYTTNHGSESPNSSVFEQAAKAMEGSFVECPINVFLDMLPEHHGMPSVDFGPFQRLVDEASGEKALYDPWIKVMKPYIHKDWAFVNTSDHADPNSQTVWGEHAIKPDVSLYGPGRKPNAPVCDASEMESNGEFKWSEVDEPFRRDTKRKAAKNTPSQKKRKLDKGKHKAVDSRPFEHPSREAGYTRGQLTIYANAIQARQLRTRVFTFYIRKQFCRLLCHSRAGMLVTPLFDYTQQSYLQTFFWRFTHAESGKRGIDDTFVPVSSSNTGAEMIKRIRKALNVEETEPLFMIEVPEASDEYRAQSTASTASSSGSLRKFYVSRCFTANHNSPLGRGSRCFSAYDSVSDSIVLLKDIWRVDEYHPEAETYRKLHQANVPNVLDVIAFDDIKGELHVAVVAGPKSRFHVHYRIVLGQVGRPLKDFESTHQLTCAILDAVRTHQRAYEDAKILHRDVSAGNIIFYQGKGWLIDWELARWVDKDSGARARERTGTWQFLSIRILGNPTVFHEARDDLESFVYVLLWIAGRYASPDSSPEERAFYLEQFDYEPKGASLRKKRLIITGKASLKQSGVKPGVFYDLLADLIERLKEACNVDEAAQEAMLSYTWLVSTLTKKLENEVWRRINDKAASPPADAERKNGVLAYKDRNKRVFEEGSEDEGSESDSEEYEYERGEGDEE